MVKFLFPLVPVFLGLIFPGCARLPWPGKTQEGAPAPIALEGLRQRPLSGARDKKDVLYRLLVAEFAGQNGDYAVALENYLQVAAQVTDSWVAERATQIALYLNDLKSARHAVKLWLERAPRALNAHKVALMLALQADEIEPAVTHFSQVLELAGDNLPQVLLDIVGFMDQGAPKETALKVMAKASQGFPRSPEVLYAYAVLALRKGETQLALEQISRAVALRPNWPKLRLLQSQLLAQLGEDRKAQQILQELMQKHPKDLQLRFMYAQLLLKQQKFDKALRELEQILKREPDHPDVLYAYALVNLQQGRDAVAERALRRLRKQDKWRNEASFYLGRIAAHRGQWEQALAWFERVDTGELAFDAQVQAAAVLAKLRRNQEALQRLESLRERFPERKLQVYLLQAEIQTNLKEYPAAFATLSQALTEFPKHPDLLYARALVAEQIGKADIAIDDLKAALASRSEDANLLNALGYTLLEHTDQIQEARAYLDQAIRLKPEDPAILDSYGWLWYKLGDYSKARKYLQRAYALNPDPEIAFHLGEVLWALGDKQEARRLWHEVLKAPQDERVQSLIERFRDRLKP
ncbi:tetratricopeptide repeat protein [Methylothermus subterraneus]